MNEKDLYFACMGFCEAFTKLLCDKQEMHMRKLYFDEVDHYGYEDRIEVEEKWVRSKFDYLCKVVDELRSDEV